MECSGGCTEKTFRGDYGFLIGQFTLARLYGILNNILGQLFNLRVQAGHLACGKNRLDTTSSRTPNDERMNHLSVLICRYM